MEPTPQELLLEQAEALNAMRDRLLEVAPHPQDLNKLVPELQDWLGGADGAPDGAQDTQAAEMDLSAMVSELDQVINSLKAKMAATGEVIPELSDQIANLQNVQSEIQGLLSQLQNGMATPEMVRGAIAALGVGATNATEAAHSSSVTSISEMKMESYDAVYTQYEEAKLEYARELMAQTEYFKEMEGMLGAIDPIYSQFDKETLLDIGSATLKTTINNKDLLVDQLVVNGVSAENKAKAEAQIEKDQKDFQTLRDDPATPFDKREDLEAFLDARDGRLMPGDLDLLNKHIAGEIRGDAFTAALSNADKRSASLRRDALNGMSNSDFWRVMDAKPKDMSLDEYLEELHDRRLDVLAQAAKVSQALAAAEEVSEEDLTVLSQAKWAGTYDNVQSMSRLGDYLEHMGLDEELTKELSGLTREELVQRLVDGDEKLQAVVDFIDASPEEAVEQMREAGYITTEQGEQTMLMVNRQLEYIKSKALEGDEVGTKADLLKSYATLTQTISEMKAVDSEEAKRRLAEQMKQQMIANPTLNPDNVPPANMEAYAMELAAASAQAKTTDEYLKKASEIGQKYSSEENVKELAQRAMIRKIDDINQSYISRNSSMLNANDVMKDAKQNGYDEIYKELRKDSTVSDEKARSLMADELGLETYNPSASAILPYLKEQAQTTAENDYVGKGMHLVSGNMADLAVQGGISDEYVKVEAQRELKRLAYEEFQKDPLRFSEARKDDNSASSEMFELASQHLASLKREKNSDLSYDQSLDAAKRQMATDARLSPEAVLFSEAEIAQQEADKKVKLAENAQAQINEGMIAAAKRYEANPLNSNPADKSLAMDYYRLQALQTIAANEELTADEVTSQANLAAAERQREIVAAADAKLAEAYRNNPSSISDAEKLRVEDYLYTQQEARMKEAGLYDIEAMDAAVKEEMAKIEQEKRISDEDLAMANALGQAKAAGAVVAGVTVHTGDVSDALDVSPGAAPAPNVAAANQNTPPAGIGGGKDVVEVAPPAATPPEKSEKKLISTGSQVS